MRVVLALGGRELTTTDLAEHLPDVPRTSLYRHVGALVDGGVIEVVGERAVRGATERTLRLASPEVEAESLEPDDLRTGIVAFTGAVAAQFTRAVDHGVSAHDAVTMRQAALDLSDAQALAMLHELREVVERYEAAAPDHGARRHLLSVVMHPSE